MPPPTAPEGHNPSIGHQAREHEHRKRRTPTPGGLVHDPQVTVHDAPARAADSLEACLKVGRLLPTPLLAVVVVARNIVLTALTWSLVDEYLAPTWIIVRDRRSQKQVLRIAGGRQIGVGEHLHGVIRADLHTLGRGEFLAKWAGAATRSWW